MAKPAGRVVNPRKYPALVSALEYLRELGATDVVTTVKGHVHLSWCIGPRRVFITMACSPACDEHARDHTRQAIRRRYRELSVQLPAR